jgi:hypothetical protein
MVTVEAVKFKLSPTHTGELEPNNAAAGLGLIVTKTVIAVPGQPFAFGVIVNVAEPAIAVKLYHL